MKINEGNRVGVIQNGQLLKGVVKNVYPEINLTVVKFDSGTVEKVALTNLAILPEEESKKPVEKKEITITPEEFEKIGVDVCVKLVKKLGHGMTVLCSAILGALHNALFFEGEND